MSDYDPTLDEDGQPLMCLDRHHSDVACKGNVELRPAMSPTGRWFPRCEKHLTLRLKEQRRISRTYGTRMFYADGM